VDRLADLTMAPENATMRAANCRDVELADAQDIARRVLSAA
jgi:hypothetical protein